ncbi:hypothetical protein AAHA92_02717 [Salvia divinorum]
MYIGHRLLTRQPPHTRATPPPARESNDAGNRPPPPRKIQRQKPATKTSHGFGGEKKSPVWQCVEKCSACCKLDKGPTFPSPEEIFDDPSDVVRLCGDTQFRIQRLPLEARAFEGYRRFRI